ncbi:DUF2993 domain-containing protein, partial [Streptomyces sp. NPDC048845]|uniref:LmeA family phospholipid-binding protein n=1 Tax=Streptomyces sp. NPDC048845 TaxID=3155390 RepID=UPI0034304A1E
MRALRILLITAVVLGGLFVAADRVAVGLAEDEVAKKVRSSQGLKADPKVSIEGFPFLTQVATKELEEVRVDLDGMTASAEGHALRVTEMTANLYDVRIGGNFSTATAASATGAASIGYSDLSKAADEGIMISYGGESDSGKPQVKVTANISLPGLPAFNGSVLSTVSIVDGDTL